MKRKCSSGTIRKRGQDVPGTVRKRGGKREE
jgi:hypothetical protein